MKLLRLFFVALSLLCAASVAVAAKPSGPATTKFTPEVGFSGAFEQVISFKTGSSGSSLITVSGSLASFSALSFTLQSQTFVGATTAGTLAATFDDASSASINLAPGQTYALTVRGVHTSVGNTYTFQGINVSQATALKAMPVPEPESYAMFLAGLGLIGAIVLRKSMSV